MNFRKTIILLALLLIGFVGIRFFIPKLTIPYINLSILLLLSIYLWEAIRQRIFKKNNIIKYLLSILFWSPLIIVVTASVFLTFTKLDDWPPFLRVYFIGGLFVYILSLFFPVLFLFIADIVKWLQLLFQRSNKKTARKDGLQGNPISRKKFLVNTGLSLGGIALGTMGFGMLHGNYNFKLWHHKLNIRRVPNSLKGLKIVQISDMHLGTWVSTKPLEEVVAYINSYKPDLIFFTGDLVNSKTSEAFPFEDTLKELRSKYGTFACLGNHDYGHYYKWKSKLDEQKNWDDLLRFYEKIGWKLLQNDNAKIEIGESKIQIIGVENWSVNPRFPQKGDIEKSIDANYNAHLNLLLSHDPTHWEQKAKHYSIPLDITFSGHTHGFQFGIESEIFRWSPAQYIYKHWAGIYHNEDKSKFLNVNRGIGAIGFPGRVGIRPEITIIELI